jgi:Lantibiotic biosynthesis dehydratase C-term
MAPDPEGIALSLVPLSANIYFDRHLDDLLSSVLQPFRYRFQEQGDATSMFWFSRYARGGEHLKLRLHVPQENWLPYKEDLSKQIEKLFAATPTGGAVERTSAPALPPVDEEDAVEGNYPDRTILWTCFRPSPITVGSPKYLGDSQFLKRFYLCMTAGCAAVLDFLSMESATPTSKWRQKSLMKLAITGLCALPLHPQEIPQYLTYHRDWLLRYLLVSLSANTTAEQTLRRLDQQVAAMDATVASVSSVIRGQIWTAGEESETSLERSELRLAFRDFFEYIVIFRGNPEYDLDPYTSDAAFLPLFKVLHGFANQVGVPIIQELYTYHLLLHSFEKILESQEVGVGKG